MPSYSVEARPESTELNDTHSTVAWSDWKHVGDRFARKGPELLVSMITGTVTGFGTQNIANTSDTTQWKRLCIWRLSIPSFSF
ncbi:unnamed protein product, partial [Fusarium fujikuroi]